MRSSVDVQEVSNERVKWMVSKFFQKKKEELKQPPAITKTRYNSFSGYL